MPNKHLLSLLLFFSFTYGAYSQCTNNVNLNTWIQEGSPVTGSWVVDPTGSSVLQTINFFGLNAKPTYFVSPDSFINVKINGTIRVNANGYDDDWIGFVFGYHHPTGLADSNNHDLWLFDWKQDSQTLYGFFANEGMALSHIQGNIPNNSYSQYFYSHVSDPTFNVVGTNYGTGTGWAHDTNYDFTLVYTATRAIIIIDNDTIFDVVDCFEPGRFGFYNHSQAQVLYSNFSYELITNYEVLTPVVCPGDTAKFLFEDVSCGGLGQGSANITSWTWNFGDNNTSNQINPNHIYNSSGLFDVEMIVTDNIGCIDTVTKQVLVLPVPDVDLGADTTVCIGDTVLLDGDAGFPFATYLWQNNNIDSTFEVTGPGTYWVEATSTCGTDRDSIDVNYLAPPSNVSLGADTMLCFGAILNLDATYPLATYVWHNGSTNPSVNIDAAGTYFVTVTNMCGSDTDSIDVSYIGPPSAFFLGNDTTFCTGGNLMLDATQPNVVYQWQDNSANPTFNVTSSGIYHATLTNICGQETDTINVAVLSPPSPVNFGDDTTLCDAADLLLDATQPDVEYFWHDNSANPTFTVTQPGTYSVVVSNICGQEGDTLNVLYENSPLAVNLGNDTTLCEATSLLLNASQAGNVAYLWQDNSKNPTFNVTTAGNYQVTVSNICGTETDDINIGIQTAPIPFTLGRDTMLCNGITMLLNATQAGVTYQWQDNSSEPTFTVDGPGIYMVTVENDCGQESSAIAVDYIAPPQPVLLGSDTSVCEGAPFVLDPKQPGMDYAWQDGSDSSAFVVTETGIYRVMVSNECGEESGSIDVEFRPGPDPVLFTADTIICDEEELFLDVTTNAAGVTYTWQDGSTSPTYTIKTPGLYQVRVENDCGLESGEIKVNFSDCDCTVYLANAFSPNGDGINDFFKIAYDCNILMSNLIIFNQWGKIVYQSNDINAQWDGTSKGKALPEGAYSYFFTYTGTELDKELNVPMKGTIVLIR